MIFIKNTVLYIFMVATLGALLIPTITKPMRKKPVLKIGLFGHLDAAKDLPQQLKKKLRKKGIKTEFYYAGYNLPEGVKGVQLEPKNIKPGKGADVYLYLNAMSLTPLPNDLFTKRLMEELKKQSATNSVIHIHLVPSMTASDYVKNHGQKIRDFEDFKSFPSGLFLNNTMKKELDDVFISYSQGGKLAKNVPTQMDQLIQLLIKVASEVVVKPKKRIKDPDEFEGIEYLEQEKKLPRIEKEAMKTKVILPKSRVWSKL